MMIHLDFSAFEQALKTLDEAIKKFATNKADDFVRDACIQRFEYNYELASKMLRRFLTNTESVPTEITEMSFPDLIRLGSKRGLLLHDWERWSQYRVARNLISHTYDRKKADEVMSLIPDFFLDAQHLLNKLKEQG